MQALHNTTRALHLVIPFMHLCSPLILPYLGHSAPHIMLKAVFIFKLQTDFSHYLHPWPQLRSNIEEVLE